MSKLDSLNDVLFKSELNPNIQDREDLNDFLDSLRNKAGVVDPESVVFLEPQEDFRKILCIARTINGFSRFLKNHPKSWASVEKLRDYNGRDIISEAENWFHSDNVENREDLIVMERDPPNLARNDNWGSDYLLKCFAILKGGEVRIYREEMACFQD